MTDAIALEGLTKTFGAKVAVQGLDLTVPRGSLYGLIGPNGAGKTTSIRMIMSILFPDSGRLSVLGRASALEAKDRIGYLPEERGVYKKMKVASFLRHMAVLKGVEGSGLSGRVERWLERVDLADVGAKRCEELSKGMQQKVQFISAVIHEPDLLILDEPFSGLDPVNMRLLKELILEQHGRGATILFSTHVMHQAERICEHIVMIHDGIKVLDDPLEAIRAGHDARTVLFEPLNPGADVAAFGEIAVVESVERAEGRHRVHLAEDADVGAAIQALVAKVPPARVELHRPTLEDIFIDIVSSARRGAAAGAAELRAALAATAPGGEAVGAEEVAG